MPQIVQRGFLPDDNIQFSDAAMQTLLRAQREICFLLDHGFEMEKTVTFVGNHYQLSARQRMALTRASSSQAQLEERAKKRISGALDGRQVQIDGFNLIITLETALSASTLLCCMDGTARDLCGLHGTYRLIDKTEPAVCLILEELRRRGAASAWFWLDAPVSNSGRLRGEIVRLAREMDFPAEVQLVPNADAMLWEQDCAVTSDAVILDRCGSWVNLAREIIDARLPGRCFVKLDGGDPPSD